MPQHKPIRNGNLRISDLSAEDIEHFWSRVIKGENPDDHWHWTGRDGKPVSLTRGTTLCIGYNRCLVTRLVYELVKGPIDGRLDLHHTCADDGCMNPAHLQAGRRTVIRKNPNRERGKVLRLVFLPQNIRVCDKVPLRKRCPDCWGFYTGYAGDHTPHNCAESREAFLANTENVQPLEMAKEKAA